MTNINLIAERHIRSLSNNSACIKAPDGTKEPVSMDFYCRAVEQCVKGGCNAIAYELELPGIEGDFQIIFWKLFQILNNFHYSSSFIIPDGFAFAPCFSSFFQKLLE